MSSRDSTATVVALLAVIAGMFVLLGLSAFVWITGFVSLTGVSFGVGVLVYLVALAATWAVSQVLKAAGNGLR
jgi:hypothetical protein